MKINLLFLFYLMFSFNAYSVEIKNFKSYKSTSTKLKIEKITENVLDFPWGITFTDKNSILVTQKNGKIFKIDVKTGSISEINHSIQSIDFNENSFFSQQGGLLDIYYHKGYVYFSYSHDYNDKDKNGEKLKNSNTAIARGVLSKNKIINIEILLIGKPKLTTNIHWGSKIVIDGNHLFASFGDRGRGMIAQDPTKHPGSIIRINLDGSVPLDNPAFKKKKNWLPEIYQIGVRNPQGIALSPYNNDIIFSQHGPKGGDNIGKINFGGNYGWKNIAWGGSEYSGFKIGKFPFEKRFNYPFFSWVPSIGIGNLEFYNGKEFSEWNGDLIISATKANMLFRIDYEGNKVINEEFIIKEHQEIGRIRDFEIDYLGNIYLISDHSNSALWKISKQ